MLSIQQSSTPLFGEVSLAKFIDTLLVATYHAHARNLREAKASFPARKPRSRA